MVYDDAQIEEALHSSTVLRKVDERVVASCYSWKSVKERTGKYEQILSQTIVGNSDEIIIHVLCKFEKEESEVTIILSKDDLKTKSMNFTEK